MIPDRFAWSVAVRGLRHNKGQTLLSVGVVAISVVLIIFMGSLITGLQQRLTDDVTGAIAHIEMKPAEREAYALWEGMGGESGGDVLYMGKREAVQQRKTTIEDWQVWVTRLRSSDPRVIAVSPTVQGQGFASRGARREAVAVYGVFPEEHEAFVGVEENLIAGRFLGLDTQEIAIGDKLAETLGVAYGDRLRLVGETGVSESYTVAGVFSTGYQGVDDKTVYMPLRDAQSLLTTGAGVTHIGLKLSELFEADMLAERLERQVPFESKSWMADNQQLLDALSAQSRTMQLILSFTTIAAGFGIASILIMLVVSKMREVGILKAMGASPRQIMMVFTLEGTLMGLLGAIIGTVLGVLMSWGFAQVTTVDGGRTFPIEVSPGIVVLAIGVALAVGFGASLYPARRAAKVNPIEVIHGN